MTSTAPTGTSPWRCAVSASSKALRMKSVSVEVVTLIVSVFRQYRAPEWARTTNLRLRRPTLYPIELRAHGGGILSFGRIDRVSPDDLRGLTGYICANVSQIEQVRHKSGQRGIRLKRENEPDDKARSRALWQPWQQKTAQQTNAVCREQTNEGRRSSHHQNDCEAWQKSSMCQLPRTLQGRHRSLLLEEGQQWRKADFHLRADRPQHRDDQHNGCGWPAQRRDPSHEEDP